MDMTPDRGLFRRNLIFQVPSHRCHAWGRKGREQLNDGYVYRGVNFKMPIPVEVSGFVENPLGGAFISPCLQGPWKLTG